jgi:hypothetical protein
MISARILLTLACVGLALGVAFPAKAQQSPPAKNNARSELMDLFTEFCLLRFPDDGTAAQYSGLKGFRPMPQEKLRALLGDDTGSGWFHETGYGTYAVTIKQPPSHACTISNRLEKAGDINDAFGTTLLFWVGTRHIGSLGVFPPTEQDVSGHKAELYRWALTRVDGTKETFTALVTPADAETEIRLERVIPDQ